MKKIYYGWWIVAVCFLMIFVTLGFGSYGKATYLKAICDDLGYDRSAFSINDSLRYIGTGLLSFVFGKLVFKLKPGRMIALGFLFLISAFAVYCVAAELWHFYVGGVLLGAGFAWTGTAIVGYIMENWFPSNKGTIMGIILAANGIGGALSELIINPIVMDFDKVVSGNGFLAKILKFLSYLTGINVGWRLGYLITAILCAITAVIVISVIRAHPADKGIEPISFGKAKTEKKGTAWEGYELKVLLRKPYFYMSAICVFVFGFVLQSSSGIAKPHMQDYGFSTENLTMLFAFSALILTCSKIFVGFLFDKRGITAVIIFSGTCAVISTLCLSLITSVAMLPAWIYSILNPLALPLETIAIPLLVSQMFGQKAYSSILGYYLAINMLGYATGAPIINLFYDFFGSYNGILAVQTVAVLLTTVVSVISVHLANKDKHGASNPTQNK